MSYQIAIDPALQIRADDFSVAWNEHSICQTIATAQAQVDTTKSYDLSLNDIILLVILPTAGNILASGLYDLIKDILLKQGIRKQTRIVQQKQPDGTELLIVTLDEES